MYFPLNQITTNLDTNGEEYYIASTNKPYVGKYFKTSKGTSYTGATPKDGPSAGITILTSLISLLTQRKVKNNFAMSGEITLRGKVLPVGGIKEKVLAAKRANVKEIILSSDNQKHVNDIDSKYLKGLKFHYVSEMKDVIGIAIMKNKISNSIEF